MGLSIPVSLITEFDRHRELAEVVFGSYMMTEKTRAMTAIKEQTAVFKKLFDECSAEERVAIQSYVLRINLPLLNKTAFATANGIAFCAVFSPYMDPTAYAVTRKLQKISSLEQTIISWTVITTDLSQVLKCDSEFDFYFAAQQFASRFETGGTSYYDPIPLFSWGDKATSAVPETLDIQYLYSRSQPPVSHIPALRYKGKNPDIKWFAEFSDPISVAHQNIRRAIPPEIGRMSDFDANYFENIELSVYEAADCLIFTNENQYEFMCNCCSREDARRHMQEKHMTLMPVTVDKRFCDILDSSYPVPADKINIGYFGICLYKKRTLESLFALLSHQDVMLHIFSSSGKDGQRVFNPSEKIFLDDLAKNYKYSKDRVVINGLVGNLEALNIASKMDYLYVEDMEFPGPINPYLPSKLADYLSTGTKIIAKVQQSSAMSKIEHPDVIKITQDAEWLIKSLKKQK
jgi:hypothetical protein